MTCAAVAAAGVGAAVVAAGPAGVDTVGNYDYCAAEPRPSVEESGPLAGRRGPGCAVGWEGLAAAGGGRSEGAGSLAGAVKGASHCAEGGTDCVGEWRVAWSAWQLKFAVAAFVVAAGYPRTLTARLGGYSCGRGGGTGAGPAASGLVAAGCVAAAAVRERVRVAGGRSSGGPVAGGRRCCRR